MIDPALEGLSTAPGRWAHMGTGAPGGVIFEGIKRPEQPAS